jgi:hypothetical protein
MEGEGEERRGVNRERERRGRFLECPGIIPLSAVALRPPLLCPADAP